MGAWRGRSAFKRGQRRDSVKLVLLALALIVFVRLDTRSAPKVARDNNGLETDPNGARRQQSSFGVVAVSAAYLDSIGQLTNVMNEFVNALLEKVSFLAEIIIESSLEEECPSPFLAALKSQPPGAGNLGSPTNQVPGARRRRDSGKRALVDADACRHYGQRHNLTAGSNSPRLSRDNFDANEFRDVDLFLSAYLRDVATKPPAHLATPQGAGCKLFTFDLSPEDLPAEDMGLCCYQFHGCYSTCARTKLECDRQFRACLTGICKANFNYKNGTLVRAFEATRAQQATSGGRNLGKRDAEPGEDGLDMGYEPSASGASASDESEELLELDVEESRRAGGRAVRQVGGPEPAEESQQASESGASGQEDGAEMDARAIKRMRDKYKACKLASKLLIIGNLAFGCQNYRQAQWRACCD